MSDEWKIAKWVCIAIASMFAAVAVDHSVRDYSDSQTDVAAMENGYVQQVVDGEKIWVKAEE